MINSNLGSMQNKLFPQEFKPLALAVLYAITANYSSAASASVELEEIIVTAQKREQNLQDVPLAVTAFTSETIKNQHISDFTDIFLYTPGLVSAPDYQSAERTTVRGLGSEQFGFGFDAHVGLFVDGVYQGRSGAQTTEMYDISRVEVIKGPVGALFGRSSIAGAISITRNKPVDEFEGQLNVGLGELGHQSYTGVVNMPLTDKLYLRAGTKYEEEDGYINNIATGEELGAQSLESGRLALRYAGDSVDATLTANYEERVSQTNIYQHTQGLADGNYYGVPTTFLIVDPAADLSLAPAFGNSYDTSASLRPENVGRVFDVMADIEIDLSEHLTLRSLSSYKENKTDYVEDFDGSAIPDLTYFGPFGQVVDTELAQQEFLFNYTSENDWVWLFGASYYEEEVSARTTSGISDSLGAGFFFGVPRAGTVIQTEISDTEGDYSGWSSFLDITIPITSRVDLTLGARYTYDEKEVEVFIFEPNSIAGNQPPVVLLGSQGYTSAPVTNKDDWDDTTFRAAINFTLSNDISFYASYAQGFKSGGIDNGSFEFPANSGFVPFFGQDVTTLGGTPKAVDPETSDSYEVGMKSFWLDRSLQFNVSGFFYEFRDQQRLILQGANLLVENVGEVEGKGIEADVRFLPSEHWDISTTLSYLDVEVTEDDISPENIGEPTGRAPEWSASLIATYSHPAPWGGELYTTYSYTYQDEMRTDINPDAEYLPSIELSNLRVGYDAEDNNWGLALYVDNLFDKFVYYDRRAADGVTFLFDQRRNIGKPRTMGIDAHYRF